MSTHHPIHPKKRNNHKSSYSSISSSYKKNEGANLDD